MNTIVDLYSEKAGEISRFLYDFYNEEVCSKESLKWEKVFENPVEIADIARGFYW